MRVLILALLVLLAGCAGRHRTPAGALILFDGTATEAWAHTDGRDAEWTIEDNSLVVAGGTGDIVTRERFGDCLLHVEWMVRGGGSGQGAGNSGIKMQQRYEVQILDTAPGGVADASGAGGIYAHSAPEHNVSLGPDRWQSFDIWFTAPRWESNEKRTNAILTVEWNGVLVHREVRLDRGTGNFAPPEVPGEAPVLLQDHWHNAEGPVRFRNIWILLPPRIESYDVPDVRYVVGQPIEPNAPDLTRSRTETLSIRPRLPRGLRFDRRTGAITGTPREISPLTEYIVHASNRAGTDATRLKLAVLKP